ncbi:NAD(P)H-dependent oxidoreductase [Agrococcus baldri]|uniref:NAD(P)H dehydrogenase n=1 Tax=Agrococcus baldri TaxID=153730 RepID=A0AA87REB6_9MICO|nr:NAD(P)H-dependent oxidoreductase [Agrococcus baldri]GEK81127.1 NAD(P)H dehydrogenase [Agrococcus baldri]
MSTASVVLWVSAHPEPRSLTGSLRRDGIAHLRGLGHEVLESDLYAMHWDPVLAPVRDEGRFHVTADTRRDFLEGTQPPDVAREQEKLRRADAVVLQFPLWWYGVPAIMKGWFDRVLVSGFAFGKDAGTGRRLRFEQGPFAGTRALVAVTLGDRPASIGPRGKSGELEQLLFGLLHGTLAYTGMHVLRPWALPSADFAEHDGAAAASLRARLDDLLTAPPIPYRPQFTGDYTDDWELAPHIRPGETGLDLHVERA